MRESEPHRPTKLSLYYGKSSHNPQQKFQNSVALPFEQVLPEAVMQKVLEAQGVRYRQMLYTPIVVIWAWLSQVIDADKSWLFST